MSLCQRPDLVSQASWEGGTCLSVSGGWAVLAWQLVQGSSDAAAVAGVWQLLLVWAGLVARPVLPRLVRIQRCPEPRKSGACCWSSLGLVWKGWEQRVFEAGRSPDLRNSRGRPGQGSWNDKPAKWSHQMCYETKKCILCISNFFFMTSSTTRKS